MSWRVFFVLQSKHITQSILITSNNSAAKTSSLHQEHTLIYAKVKHATKDMSFIWRESWDFSPFCSLKAETMKTYLYNKYKPKLHFSNILTNTWDL